MYQERENRVKKQGEKKVTRERRDIEEEMAKVFVYKP